MPFEGRAHVVGMDLEAAADDDAVGATDDPEEAVGVDARQIGGADPRGVLAELRGLHLEQPFRVGTEHAAVVGVDDAQRTARVRATDAAALRGPELPVVGQVPAGDAAAELGRGVRAEHRNSVLGHERLGVVGRQRRGARDHRADAAQVGGIDVGLEHHAQRGGHEARRRRPVAADGVDPGVDREALEERERAAVADALQDAEQTAEVDERRVDDRDAGAQAKRRVAIGLVVLRADEDAAERLVREVDALRRTGGAAGQHLHGDARRAATDRRRRGRVARRRPRRRARRASSRRPSGPTSRSRSSGSPATQGSSSDAISRRVRSSAALRVDRDDARAGAQRAEQERDLGRSVAQQHADARARDRECAATDSTVAAELAPRAPATFELDRRRRGIDGEHRGDALAELVRRVAHQRILGGRRGCGERAASALPIGLPSRV